MQTVTQILVFLIFLGFTLFQLSTLGLGMLANVTYDNRNWDIIYL
jgi:hypothetical protein